MGQPLLFKSLSLRSVTLKNRVVVAPMHQYSAIGGFATDWHLVNAGRYAQGGAGLVKACDPDCEDLYEDYLKPTYGAMGHDADHQG